MCQRARCSTSGPVLSEELRGIDSVAFYRIGIVEPEDCPWREERYEREGLGSDETFTRFYCTATDGGDAILGDTKEEALERFCNSCIVPERYEDLPEHVEPQLSFYLGGNRDYLWHCTICGMYAHDLEKLEDCHD